MSIYRYLSKLVEDALAEYFVEPETQRYDLGALEWKRLVIKPDILHSTCDIPILLTGNQTPAKALQLPTGTVEKVSISIPWNLLRTNSVIEVQIKGVAIVLAPTDPKNWPQHDPKVQQDLRFQRIIERLKDQSGLVFADGTLPRVGDQK